MQGIFGDFNVSAPQKMYKAFFRETSITFNLSIMKMS